MNLRILDLSATLAIIAMTQPKIFFSTEEMSQAGRLCILGPKLNSCLPATPLGDLGRET